MRYHVIVQLIFLFVARVALAQLSFQNTSTEDIYVAIRFLEDDIWKTKGWYKVGPLQTEVVIGRITNRYYYFYAKGESRVWEGSDSFGWIHSTEPFSTSDDQRYTVTRSFKKVGLRQIDVGSNSKFTYRLDTQSKFLLDIEKYLTRPNLDPIEGLYSISDEVTFGGTRGNAMTTKSDPHWAKVAIIKDTINLSRNYIEFVIESTTMKEGYVRAEYLQTKQNPKLFITKQQTKDGLESRSFSVEFNQEEGIIEGKYEFADSDYMYFVKRSYLKYFPK